MLRNRIMFQLIVLLCTFLMLIGGASAQEPITLQFFYPVGVAGPLAQAIDSYVAEFNSLHDDIQVKPIFHRQLHGEYGPRASRDYVRSAA